MTRLSMSLKFIFSFADFILYPKMIVTYNIYQAVQIDCTVIL